MKRALLALLLYRTHTIHQYLNPPSLHLHILLTLDALSAYQQGIQTIYPLEMAYGMLAHHPL